MIYLKKLSLQKTISKEKLINMTFFQLLILVFDFETLNLLKISFGYDSEIIHLNAHAAITMFKDDLLKDNNYFVSLKMVYQQ